jgi:hypothetical protein
MFPLDRVIADIARIAVDWESKNLPRMEPWIGKLKRKFIADLHG